MHTQDNVIIIVYKGEEFFKLIKRVSDPLCIIKQITKPERLRFVIDWQSILRLMSKFKKLQIQLIYVCQNRRYSTDILYCCLIPSVQHFNDDCCCTTIPIWGSVCCLASIWLQHLLFVFTCVSELTVFISVTVIFIVSIYFPLPFPVWLFQSFSVFMSVTASFIYCLLVWLQIPLSLFDCVLEHFCLA